MHSDSLIVCKGDSEMNSKIVMKVPVRKKGGMSINKPVTTPLLPFGEEDLEVSSKQNITKSLEKLQGGSLDGIVNISV